MKSAEELFVYYSFLDKDTERIMSIIGFKQALTEHDKEIIGLIDERIEAIKPKITNEISSNEYYEWTACIAILTELRNKLTDNSHKKE